MMTWYAWTTLGLNTFSAFMILLIGELYRRRCKRLQERIKDLEGVAGYLLIQIEPGSPKDV